MKPELKSTLEEPALPQVSNASAPTASHATIDATSSTCQAPIEEQSNKTSSSPILETVKPKVPLVCKIRQLYMFLLVFM